MATAERATARARPSWRSRAWKVARLVVLAYVGVLIVLLALERRIIFPAAKAAESWYDKPDSRIEDVTFPATTGETIHAWWVPRPGASGALLYAHGNAGNLSHRGQGILRWADELNVAVLIYDYPGYGKSTGRPHEPGCYAAAEAAHQWLTSVPKVEPQRVLLLGASLGASMALDLACRHDHRAVILIKPFSSIPDMAQARFPWLPARYFVRSRFDNAAKVCQCRRPVFVTHGTADSVVPFRLGERVFAAANEPKEFLRLDGHDHNTPLPGDFFQRLRSFLDRHSPD